VAFLWMALLALAVALLLSGPAGPAAPAYGATDQPTISFTGDGPAPLACSSQPDVPNVTVKRNTRIVLANFTGADATAEIRDGQSVAVADGAAVSVKLKDGTYTIMMKPACLDTYDVVATVITVVGAEPPSPPPPPPVRTDPSAGPTPTPTASGDRPAPVAQPGSSIAASPDASGSRGTSPTDGSGSTGAPAAGGGVPGSAPAELSGPPEDLGPDVQTAIASRPVSHPDLRGGRLLALIAAICVFGVTSAIIRAIVAQRATGAVGI
jgi:hypothetical protein